MRRSRCSTGPSQAPTGSSCGSTDAASSTGPRRTRTASACDSKPPRWSVDDEGPPGERAWASPLDQRRLRARPRAERDLLDPGAGLDELGALERVADPEPAVSGLAELEVEVAAAVELHLLQRAEAPLALGYRHGDRLADRGVPVAD